MATDFSKWIYTKTATPYVDAYNKLANEYNAQAAKDRADINNRQTADLNKSNAQYDSTAKQNYINYMQAQKRLPSQLNALGIRGGASESSAIRLNTNYGSNVASNEAARNSAAESIRNAYAQQIADYNKNLNERLAQARATAEQNQLAFEREQMDKDLERFSGVIEGLYTDKKGYQKLIEQLQASNDPNKDYKIMLATRAMNMLGGSGGGGGGSRSYGGYGGGYGGYSNTTETTNNSKDAKTKNGETLKSKYGSGANIGKALADGIKNAKGGGNSSPKSKSLWKKLTSKSSSGRHGGKSNTTTNWWKRYTR
jgi:hypothetical protein